MYFIIALSNSYTFFGIGWKQPVWKSVARSIHALGAQSASVVRNLFDRLTPKVIFFRFDRPLTHFTLFSGGFAHIRMLPGNKKRKRATVQVVHDPDSDDEVEIGVSINPSQNTQGIRSHRVHFTESMPLGKRTRAEPLHTSTGQITYSTQASVTTPAEEKRRKQVNYMWLV
jgi:hypothetical protein